LGRSSTIYSLVSDTYADSTGNLDTQQFKKYLCHYNRPNKFFSISHSFNQLIGIASEHPCGIDLEKIKDRSLSLLEYVLDNNERKLLERSFSKPLEVLYVGWTIKEACYKANSCGYNPSDYTISGLDKDIYKVKTKFCNFWVITRKINQDSIASVAFTN